MEIEEQVVQKFSYRCPYCDQPVSYNQLDLKVGENEIQCPSCKRNYIKVVSDSMENDLARRTPLPRRLPAEQVLWQAGEGIKGKGK